MKWQLLLLGILFICPYLVHAEKDCTSKKRPCDEKERCMYLRQISMKQQLLNLYGDESLRNQAYERARSELPANDEITKIMRDHRARKYFQDKIEELAKDGHTITLPECPGETKVDDPFGQFTNKDCDTFYEDFGGNVVPREAAEARDTCSEFNSAAKVHELFHKAECEKAKRTHKDRETLDNYIMEEMESYYHEVEYLKNEKSFNKALCSPTPQQSEAARDDATLLIGAATSSMP